MKSFHCSRFLMVFVSICGLLVSMLFGSVLFQPTAHAASKSISTLLTHNMPLYKAGVKANGGLLPCLGRTALPLCYSPQQIRQAYNIQPLLNRGITGKGRTIVIVDDYQSPTLVSDLALFDKIFNLPRAKLNIIAPYGLKPFDPQDPNAASFAIEIALDVEWSHAIAPDATIDLVLGNPVNSSLHGQVDALIAALTFAINNNLGSVVSLSVGTGETCYSSQEMQAWHQAFATARARHATVYVSSGDSGSATVKCDSTGTPIALVRGVDYPGSEPLVSGVGGTTLLATQSGNYLGETTWNESTLGAGATAGGFSSLFARPSYQNGVRGIGATRGVPDVAYDADPLTGFPIVTSSFVSGVTVILPIGGTSAGAPQWAGITTLADQAAGARLDFLNPTFYRILKSASYSRGFHDITTGNNAFTFQQNGKTVTVPGYDAGPGWDSTTGVGTPKVAGLVGLLAKYTSAG
jgi:subtilase family serine protease